MCSFWNFNEFFTLELFLILLLSVDVFIVSHIWARGCGVVCYTSDILRKFRNHLKVQTNLLSKIARIRLFGDFRTA